MKDKNAIVMEETLKILVAVGCIVGLVYLSFSLYGIFTQKKATEQARATISNILDKAGAMKSGESQPYIVESPKGWYVVVFREEGVIKMPAQCSPLKICLCMCEKPSVESCDETKTCKEAKAGFTIAGEDYNYIEVENIPLDTKITKTGENIEFSVVRK